MVRARKSNPFTRRQKRMNMDEYSEPTLNQAHMWVYWVSPSVRLMPVLAKA
jgi:hypothetical protein